MNAQEYISSGLLEAYVAGALSHKEREDVEAAIAQYHEVAAEVTAIEEAMWHIAQQGAVAPPPMMQEQIWNAIESERISATKNTRTIPFAGAPPSTQIFFCAGCRCSSAFRQPHPQLYSLG